MHDRMKYKNRKMDTFCIEIQSKLAKKNRRKKMPLIEIFHTLIDSTATIILMFRISLSPFILFFFVQFKSSTRWQWERKKKKQKKKFNFFNEKKNFFDWFTSKLKTFKPHKMCVWMLLMMMMMMYHVNLIMRFFFWLFFNWNSINIINNIKIIHEFLLIWGKNAIGTYRSYTTHNYTHTERERHCMVFVIHFQKIDWLIYRIKSYDDDDDDFIIIIRF